MTAHITDNIFGYLWAKQIDCSLLFAQAVDRRDLRRHVRRSRATSRALIALVGEGVGVAQRGGRHARAASTASSRSKLRPRTPAEVERGARRPRPLRRLQSRHHVKVRSGPWRDLAVRKRPTEVDYMVGWVIDEGRTARRRPAAQRGAGWQQVEGASSAAPASAACTTSTNSNRFAQATLRTRRSGLAKAMIRAHLLRWRPRQPAQRTASTPRRLPSGAASQLNPSHRSSRLSPTALKRG